MVRAFVRLLTRRRWSTATSISTRRLLYTQIDEEEARRLQPSIRKHAAMAPNPVSLEEVLRATEEPINEVAGFLQTEFSIRCAQRILMMQKRIPQFAQIEQLQQAYWLNLNAFAAVQRVGDMELDTDNNFRNVVLAVVENGRDIIPLMCQGMIRLVQENSDVDEAFCDKFLNEFLLNRIGTNVLMSQYLSICDETPTSIVNPHCDVTALCRTTARDVQLLCKRETGYFPNICVESYSTSEDHEKDSAATFAFIPAALSYILQELLKNSSVATANKVAAVRNSNSTDQARPISVVVCTDDRRVMINVGDLAGGIPFDVGQHIWSYLYTTTKQKTGDGRDGDATELGGFGVGLPLSRLYASYLGGSLNLVSLPGYGTHAYLFLPRLTENLVEIVPGHDDNEWDHAAATKSFGEFIL